MDHLRQGKNSPPALGREARGAIDPPEGEVARRSMIRCLCALLLTLLLAPFLIGCVESPPGPVPREPAFPPPGFAWAIFGTDTLLAEVADTQTARNRGLSGRDSLPVNQGMIFLFPAPQTLTFWMEGTTLPLDLAFLDSGLRIVSVHQMIPHSQELHSSPIPLAIAIETHRGWLSQRGIGVGEVARLIFPPPGGEGR